MKLKLNHKIIKEMCGTVSFKRGDSFYRTNKVIIHEYHDDFCEATVKGGEDFHVTVKKGDTGEIQTSCTCPTLPGYSKCCQHVAAVLIAIYEQSQQEILQTNFISQGTDTREPVDDFIDIFENRDIRTSGHQLHFEKRKVLDTHFTLKSYKISKEEYLLGIEVQIGKDKIQNIRQFLQDIKQGKSSLLSSQFTYDPSLHCFTQQADVVIHNLIQVASDENTFIKSLPIHSEFNILAKALFIPPTAWSSLSTILSKTPNVHLYQADGHVHLNFELKEGQLPIQFRLDDGDNGYQMRTIGFDKIVVFNSYQSVLCEGTIYQLKMEDFEHLAELKEMISKSTNHTILIPQRKLGMFLKKVVPGLKKIGDVRFSETLINEMRKTPLEAKVYLDRLKSRLLAGLEFHYENVVIQPLENRENQTGPYVVRDIKKEEEILQLMEESGFTHTEGGYFMQNEELEYHFLVHSLPKLQKLAQVYATTAVRNRIVKNNTHPKIRVKLHKERTNWLEFKFEMDGINDKQIKEILQALEVKRKYYRLPNGSLLSLESKEMEEIRRFLLAAPIQDDHYEATLNRPILESLKFLDLMMDSPIFSPEDSFRQFIDQLLNPKSLNIEVPTSLEHILHDYQKSGYKWMKALAHYGFGGVLADDMGLGKTLQSITYIVSELANIRNQKMPVLIVCPSSLTYNWLHEFMNFAPEIQAIVMDGDKTERTQLQQNMKEMDVLIISYPLLRQDITWYKKQVFHTIFFDEAQAFKNPFTQTAKVVKKLQAHHRFGLTGTPIENSIEELWSIYHVIFPQLFQGLEEYSHLTRKGIARRVHPFLLRRVKEDVLGDLPKKEVSIERSELFPEQKKLYAAFLAKLRQETLKHLDKETFQKNKIRILAGLTRLRQICCHPALFIEGYQGGSAKFNQLLQILEESKVSGRRVLIFSQFTKMLGLIGRELTNRGQAFFYLDGETPSKERVELCERFNAGERDIFLISLKAGGTGLNLTGADTVILYDLWWNPAVEEQAADRAHRIGQKNTVEVIKLISRGTIEEKIYDLQEKKRNLIAEILQSDEKTKTTLTEQDIREILML